MQSNIFTVAPATTEAGVGRRAGAKGCRGEREVEGAPRCGELAWIPTTRGQKSSYCPENGPDPWPESSPHWGMWTDYFLKK